MGKYCELFRKNDAPQDPYADLFWTDGDAYDAAVANAAPLVPPEPKTEDELTPDDFESPYREYLLLFPDDEPMPSGFSIAGCSTFEDRVDAYQWGVDNRRHWWEYPDINPELLPGFWERFKREHPDAIL